MGRALLRPGRFGKLVYVPLQNPDKRGLILKALARKKPLDTDVDLVVIRRSDGCANFSGADLFSLMNEDVMGAVEEKLSKIRAATKEGTSGSLSESLPHTIEAIHFYNGMAKFSPSISKEECQKLVDFIRCIDLVYLFHNSQEIESDLVLYISIKMSFYGGWTTGEGKVTRRG
ncbi:cell division cycle 48C [Tanacetum coccineum]